MRAVVAHDFGPPEVLHLEDVADLEPGRGQVRIRVEVAGVHLIDTQIRSGRPGPFPPPELPLIPGREVAGTIDAAGPGVDDGWRGRRVVAHLGPAGGGYAEQALAEVEALHPVPDGIDPARAVAMVGTGRTTMAILDLAQLGPGDVALITAAAGGIGSLLVEAAVGAGATAVALAGGQDKVVMARSRGAQVAVDYRRPGWPDRVRADLGATPVTVAMDGVGGAVASRALDLVGIGGRMVLFGFSSGQPMPLTAGDLFRTGVTMSAAVGARVASRPPGELHELARRALEALERGTLTPALHPPYPLADAAAAHRDLEARATAGKVVLNVASAGPPGPRRHDGNRRPAEPPA